MTAPGGRSRHLNAGFVAHKVALVILIGFAAGPIIWMALSSLRPPSDLFASPPNLVPSELTLQWYEEALRSDAPRWFANSFLIAGLVTALNAGIGLLGAYSVTRFRYAGRNAFMGAILVGYVFPSVLLLVPIYLLVQTVGLGGSALGVVMAHLAHTFPFSLWLLRSFIRTIPQDLEEAARVDGCTHLTAFIHVVLPLIRPGLIATSLFAFILSWHEYLFASVLTNGDSRTVAVGIAEFVTGYDVRWGAILALSTLVTLPAVIIFGLLQRYFERGVVAGGVKG